MPKATEQHTAPTLSRRGLASGGAALASLIGVGAVAKAAAPASLDADLIRVCAEHIDNLDAYNRDGGYLEPEECPLWAAYLRTRHVISNASPQTLEGMLAKARAAKAESLNRGEEQPEHGPAADWAWDLVGDLLRMSGRA